MESQMGYCEGTKASIFNCTFFHFLKQYTFDRNFFPDRYEKLFWREFYLVSLPIFSWQCPGLWTVFINNLLYFQTFLRVAIFSTKFSDKKLLLEWTWQQIALWSNCFQIAFRPPLFYLLDVFNFFFYICLL